MEILSSKTTGMDTFLNDKKVLEGNEIFKIHGDLIDDKTLAEIIDRCAGLKYYWDCIEKAKIARKVLGEGIVVVGKLMVFSEDWSSSYGYYFNPPFELHSWLLTEKGVIDIALPGVIEMGLNFSDENGPFLTNREPIVLAGIPANWMQYNLCEIL